MSSSDRKSLPSYTNGVCYSRVKRVRGKENETGSTNSFPAAAVAIPTALLLILEEVDVERIRDIVEPMRLKYVPSGPNGARRLQHHWIRHLNETKAEFAYGIEVFGYYRKSFTRKILWKVQELPDLPIRIEGGGGGEIGMYSRLQFFSLCHYIGFFFFFV